MKEFEFLKDFSISIRESLSSFEIRAALEIAKIQHSTFSNNFGLLNTLQNNSHLFPDLVLSTQSEIDGLGMYHPIWNRIIDPSSEPQIWAIRIGSPLRKCEASLVRLLSFVRNNREVFLRQWGESYGLSKSNMLAHNSSIRKLEIESSTAVSVESLLTSASQGEELSYRGALKLIQRASMADLGMATSMRVSNFQPRDAQRHFIHRLSLIRPDLRGNKFALRKTNISSDSSRTQLIAILLKQVEEFTARGGDLVVIDASLPTLMTLSHLEELISQIARRYRLRVMIHGAGFIEQLSTRANLSSAQCLKHLVGAGIDGVLDDDSSSSTIQWLEFSRKVHSLGLYSSSSGIKRTGDSWDSFILKLYRTRCLHKITKGFSHFTPIIPIDPQARNEKMHADYLKMVSISRLFLPEDISVYATLKRTGRYLASLALSYGADSQGYYEMLKPSSQATEGMF